MSDIVIYGRGKTGRSLYEMVTSQGKTAVFYDDKTGFDNGGSFEENTLVLLSPGVKPGSQGVREAKKVGATVMSELEYCFPLCRGKCISVTGTNGKTTTCEMIYHLLKQDKLPCRLLGNGGVPFSSQALKVEPCEWVVLESSSFQLMNAASFAPYISVFTNLARDHLDYHENYENYIYAKINNFIYQTAGYAVFNADDEAVAELSEYCRCARLFYSTSKSTANCYFDGENVIINFDGVLRKASAKILSAYAKHNLSNALAAILVAYLAGVPVEASISYLSAYRLLPHRMEFVAELCGVTFVDDSKATNVHATLSAISNYRQQNLALILGGSDKGEEFDGIFSLISDNVKAITACGDTASRIARCAEKYRREVVVFNDIKQATNYCYKVLKALGGGVVLMSNACASFDKFSGYAERGEYFHCVVKELSSGEKTD